MQCVKMCGLRIVLLLSVCTRRGEGSEDERETTTKTINLMLLVSVNTEYDLTRRDFVAIVQVSDIKQIQKDVVLAQ